MAKPTLRMTNSSRWQKNATVMLTKELKAITENTEINVKSVIEKKLKKTYIDNLKASYGPRSMQGNKIAAGNTGQTSTYEHTHTLEEAIHVFSDDKYVKVIIDRKSFI